MHDFGSADTSLDLGFEEVHTHQLLGNASLVVSNQSLVNQIWQFQGPKAAYSQCLVEVAVPHGTAVQQANR